MYEQHVGVSARALIVWNLVFPSGGVSGTTSLLVLLVDHKGVVA